MASRFPGDSRLILWLAMIYMGCYAVFVLVKPLFGL